jgi:hypothetical protein
MKSLLVTAALSLLAPVARAQQTDAVSFEEVLEIRRQFEALDAEFDDSTVASGTEDAPSNFPADALLVPPEILASEQGADALFEAQL